MGKESSKFVVQSGNTTQEFDISLIDPLPQSSKDVIVAHYEFLKKTIETENSKIEKLKVTSEQKIFELQRQLQTTSEQLQSDGKAAVECREKFADVETKYNQTTKQLREIQEKDFAKDNELHELKVSSGHLAAEKIDLAAMLERKNKEVDRLNEEWTAMSQKVADANKARVEALAKLDATSAADSTRGARMTSLEQEVETLQRQNAFLEEELKGKVDSLMASKRAESSTLLTIQSSLEEKTDEVSHLEGTVQTLRTSNMDLSARLEDSMAKLKEARDMQAAVEEQYRGELLAQEKLTALYKRQSGESEARVTELLTGATELQRLLKQATQANAELVTAKEEDCAKYVACLAERDERVTSLEAEVAASNKLLEAARERGVGQLSDAAVEELSPAAAATSRLLKSGLSLTQMYSEYVSVSEQLHLEKEENARLNDYLDQILKEIEEKAPVMKRQREDYEASLSTISALTSQVDSAMAECESLRMTADDAVRRSGGLQRDNERLRLQASDLAMQVRMLLKELEEERGVVVSRTPLDVPASDTTSSAQLLISERLVTFRSIEELQEQNQRLLEVVRELSEHQEMADKLSTDTAALRVKEELDAAVAELASMKEARERQQEMVAAIVRQRDMFRAMLSDGSPTRHVSGASDADTCPTTPETRARKRAREASGGSESHEDTKQLEEERAARAELQAEFDLYRREKGENEKLLSTQVEALRSEASNFRLQNAKLSSQTEFTNERFKIQTANVDGFKKEISAYRDKNSKFAAAVIQHEQTIATLRADALEQGTKLSRAEVKLDGVRQDRDVLKLAEARLVNERESLLREATTQNLVTANLQAIQTSLERSEFELKTRLYSQLEVLEKDKAALTRKLEGADSQNRSVVATLTRQLQAAQAQIAMEEKRRKKLDVDVQEVRANVTRLEKELSEKTEELESRPPPTGAAPRPVPLPTVVKQTPPEVLEELKCLRSQVGTEKLQLKNLQDQLSRAQTTASEYRSQAEGLEASLRAQHAASQNAAAAAEAAQRQAAEKADTLHRKVSSLEQAKSKLAAEVARLQEGTHSKSADLRAQLTSLQAELRAATARQEEAIRTEATAREDAAKQSQLAQEAQDKYQHELILHGADAQTLMTVRQDLDKYRSRVRTAEEAATQAHEELAVVRATQADAARQYRAEGAASAARLADLQGQNDLLHEQINSLSSQVSGVQQSHERDARMSAALTAKLDESEEEPSSDHLLEVVRFLRKEKEIAEARCAVLQAESIRVRTQRDTLEKQVAAAQQQLSEERGLAHATAASASQHAELLRKVESLNLLQDSNKLLRAEHDGLVERLAVAEGRVRSLEADLAPIQEAHRELTATRDALDTENTALQAEVERWKVRTNHLIEQCQKIDPEEMKRLVSEREELRKQIASLGESAQRHAGEAQAKTAELETARAECASLEAAKTDLEAKLATLTADSDKKGETILQLRQVGRKYRTVADTSKKEVESLKAEVETLKADDSKAKLEIATAELAERNAELETLVKQLEEAAEAALAANVEMTALTSSVEQQEESVAQLNEDLKTSQAEAARLTDELQQAKTELQAVKDSSTESADIAKEATDKIAAAEERSSAAEERAQTAEDKLKAAEQQAATSVEELAKLRDSHTKRDVVLNTVKAKIVAFKNDIATLTADKENFEKLLSEKTAELSDAEQRLAEKCAELSEAELRFSALRSQLEGKMAGLEAQAIAKEASDSDELGRLRKDSSELAQRVSLLQKQLDAAKPAPASIRAVPSAPVQPVRSSAGGEARATASVRPRPAHATTRTATVRPQPEAESAVVRPTQSVQPVSPRVEVEEAVMVEEAGASGEGSVIAISPLTTPPLAPPAMTPPHAPTTTHRATPGGRALPTPRSAAAKRPHESPEGEATKRVRVAESSAAGGDTEVLDEVPSTSAAALEMEEPGEAVLTEDEELDVDIEEEEGFPVDDGGQYEDPDYVEEEEGVEEEFEGADEEPELVPYAAPDAGLEGADEPDVQAAPVAPRPSQPTLQVPQRMERMPSFGGSTRFGHLPLEGGAYEGGDDSIVPSTPTLSIPLRRGDGFAEAISSPQVSGGFYASGGAAPHPLSGLAQAEVGQLGTQSALSLDTTRMDLSAMEEGRASQPATPTIAPPPTLTAAPPTITIMEPEPTSQVVSPEATHEVPSTSRSTTPAVPTSGPSPGAEGDALAAADPESDVDVAGTDMEEELVLETEILDDDEELTEAAEDVLDVEDKTPSSAGPRPRIEPIVWESPPAGSGGGEASAVPAMPPLQATSSGVQRPPAARRGTPTRAGSRPRAQGTTAGRYNRVSPTGRSRPPRGGSPRGASPRGSSPHYPTPAPQAVPTTMGQAAAASMGPQRGGRGRGIPRRIRGRGLPHRGPHNY